ncbi:hypothetical protein [Pseudarthrobacter sp. 1C304]|uniref:hypothetical protein n=1 Tax=Pseudarthrobacter sp. 1C304 TaxID=3457438 RepID=UPI003FD03EF3
MTESSGGMGNTAVMERTATDHRLELKLRFLSRDYTLPQLRRRFQDIEALLTLLLADKSMLPLSSSRHTIYYSKSGRLVSDRRSAQTEHAELLKGVVIERVSLSSPLEILAVITASTAAVAAVVKLMPKIIDVKNDWNESRVQRADSNLKLDEIELQRKLVKILSTEADKMTSDGYEAAGANNPTKRLVKSAARAIAQLDDVETKD